MNLSLKVKVLWCKHSNQTKCYSNYVKCKMKKVMHIHIQCVVLAKQLKSVHQSWSPHIFSEFISQYKTLKFNVSTKIHFNSCVNSSTDVKQQL